MENSAGVRRDFEELEKRRFEAIRLWERGETQSAIARQVKVVESARTHRTGFSFNTTHLVLEAVA